MISRRQFLRAGTAVGAAALMPFALSPRKAYAAIPALLDGAAQPKYVNALPNLLDPAFIFNPTGQTPDPTNPTKLIDTYSIDITQVRKNIGLVNPATGQPLATTLWAYGTSAQAPTFPGRTFLVNKGTRIQVSYNNMLLDSTSKNLPHLLPVDTSIDWANPGNLGALAPVPLVAHLHGGDSQYLSDGLPDAWETPKAKITGRLWSKPYTYDNVQEAAHLWYHDHALGITRLNVFTGLAGHYFIRGQDELLLQAQKKLPTNAFELPLVLQDRQFQANGEFYYPSDPSLYPFDPGTGPTQPLPPVTHLPEFFGDVMMVNGVPWPRMDVEPRQYRLRLLNGSDSRVYELRIETGTRPTKGVPAPMFVIGDELGLLNSPAPVSVLRIAPGERYDVVVDFSSLAGKALTMTNTANAPFPGGDPVVAGVSDQIMQFRVNKPLSAPLTTLATNLRPASGALPAPNPATAVKTRKILLVEGTDQFGRLQTMLGPIDSTLPANLQGTLFFKDPITEKPQLGSTEIWEFHNTTVDAHPIHMHLVDFRVLDRQNFKISNGDPNKNLVAKDMGNGVTGGVVADPASLSYIGSPTPPAAWEAGKKDTAVMFPGQVTRVIATFRRPGEYVYHCHILSHEDHEMMRPYEVVA